MIEIFNQFLDGFNYFVSALLGRMKFTDTINVGWILLAIAAMSIVVRFLYGRLKG